MNLDKGPSKLSLFWRLTISLEAFTHIVPVPVAVYFSIITSALENVEEILYVAIYASIGGTLMVLLGMVWRYYNLRIPRYVLNNIEKAQPVSNKEMQDAKIILLKHPKLESRVIALRWFIGVPLVHLMLGLTIGFRTHILQSVPFLFIIIVPVSSVAFFFLSENIIRQILGRSQMVQCHLSPKQIPYLGYFRRLLMAIGSLSLMPITLLGFLLYLVSQGSIIGNPLIQISTVTGLFVIPFVITSYAVARAVKNGLQETNTVLNQLGLGNLKVDSAVTSADEFGLQAQNLSNVIGKLREMYQEIKDVNENLEHKVHSRTEKLNNTLEEIKKLKEGQDGDYLLTSLLFKPFQQKNIEGEGISIEMYVRQKKVFSFRNWKNVEIGGDMCLAEKVFLQKKEYLFFCNADAMGKSLQGANGILIFGAIVKSIIERTTNHEYENSLSPEHWIKMAFEETNRLFESFDGSMLISCIFGLVDVNNGLVYYINAEHPIPVLSRDNHAEFLKSDKLFRKLGTPETLRDFSVQLIRLQRGDVLWIGSDGKDDIELKSNTDTRNINFDEELFLRMVEAAENRMEALISNLEEKGEFMDDLSLIRIEYNGRIKMSPTGSALELLAEIEPLYKNRDFPGCLKVYQAYPRNSSPDLPPVIFRWVAIACFFQKKYKEAAHLALNYLNHNPAHNSIIYLAARSLYLDANYMQAKHLMDRLLIRQPDKIAYIILQARILYETGDIMEAIKLLNRFPDNKVVQKLLNKINRMQL